MCKIYLRSAADGIRRDLVSTLSFNEGNEAADVAH